MLVDPAGRLGNYAVTTNLGTLTIQGVKLEFSPASDNTTFCWPARAVNLLLEYATNLEAPILWQPVTNGITVSASNVCYSVPPITMPSSRFYRLRQP